MSEKKQDDKEKAIQLFTDLFHEDIVKWESTLEGKNDDTQLKLQRRLTNTRFNALDALNLLLKQQIKDQGGSVGRDS